ncbi:WD40-repeat-containing domain protein, partial [Haematococcus lacustris]
MMHVRQDIVSVGVNRVVNAVDWSDGGLVAYGAHTMVALYEPQSAKVLATMLGHTGTVYCVKWISRAGTAALAAVGPSPHAQLLVSGSEDATLRVWQVHARALVQAAQPSTHPQQQPWSQVAVIQGHTGAVTDIAWAALPSCAAAPDCSDTCLTGPPPPDPSPAAHGGSSTTLVAGSRIGAGSRGGGLLLASCGGDASVCVWQLGGQGEVEGQGAAAPAAADPSAALAAPLPWRLAQRLSAGGHIQHALALSHLPGQPDWRHGRASAPVPTPPPRACRGRRGVSALRCAGRARELDPLPRLLPLLHLTAGREAAAAAAGAGGAAAARGGGMRVIWGQAGRGQQGGPSCCWLAPLRTGMVASGPSRRWAQGGCWLPPGLGGADPLADLMRYAPRPQLQAAGCCYDVTLESLLVGHEDWVHSVRWQPRVQIPAGGPPGGLGAEGPEGAPGLGGLPPKNSLCLLTASMDRTMALWVPE